MKKKYIIPQLQVVKIATQQMLASSPGLGGNYGNGDPVYSPGLDLDDDY
jgi:hypothetical protein